jgi:colanic acid/amylovoran biosynthesis glycosyltransferase
MEAMAAGKPVVATAVGCIPELVSPETGLVVPPGDDAALEDALSTLAHDLARARALGAAGRRVARDRFDDERTARAYERLFTELAAGGVKAHAAEATP